MQLLQEEVHIVSSCCVDNLSSFPRADDQAVMGEAREMGREGVLPDIQLCGGHSGRRGKQFLQRAQTRDMPKGRQTFCEIDFIHSSRLVDMRDKHVTPL